MKLPEIPGRIIAQMASAPAKNRVTGSAVSCSGAARVIQMAKAVPATSPSMRSQRQRDTSRPTSQTDTITSPKKNDHSGMG